MPRPIAVDVSEPLLYSAVPAVQGGTARIEGCQPLIV